MSIVAAILVTSLGLAASAGSRGMTAAAPRLNRPGTLVTALMPIGISDGGPAARRDIKRAQAAGASAIRVAFVWAQIAPNGEAAPDAFDAADPADPKYTWTNADALVRAIVDAGLEPIVCLCPTTPAWARDSGPGESNANSRPKPDAYTAFARAAAERYSGSFQDLPRVRYWELWNEPNLTPDLAPQLVGKKPVAADIFRDMVNGAADALHGVHGDNVAVAGGLAPFRDITPSVLEQNKDWGPLSFMRAAMCLSPKLKPTCTERFKADAWALHPYTSGGPTHQAVLPDDVSLGDLKKVRTLLDAAGRLGIMKQRHPAIWVTEFSWDSKPPDPRGVPMPLMTRWVAQGLYQMWLGGVRVATWFSELDEPLTKSFYQSGLWFSNGKPKPALRAFRFPVVAFPTGSGLVHVWGRTPGNERGTVLIEQRIGARWQRLGTLETRADGIFVKNYRTTQKGFVRARLMGANQVSVPFSLAGVPDRFFNPFGETTLLEPSKKK